MDDPNRAINYVRQQQGREAIDPFTIQEDYEPVSMSPRGVVSHLPPPTAVPTSPLIPPIAPPTPPPSPSPRTEVDTILTTGANRTITGPQDGLWIAGTRGNYRGREVLLTEQEHRRIIEIVLRAEARIVQEHLSEIGVVRVRRPRGTGPSGETVAPRHRGRPKGSKNKPKVQT